MNMIPFFNLSLDEKLMVLRWRNDERIRKWMKNQNEILEGDHLAFIARLNGNTEMDYRLVQDGESNLGVISLVDIDGMKAELGIYKNPELLGVKGIGTALMNAIFDLAAEKKLSLIELHVSEDNLPAIGLYEKLLFTHTGSSAGYLHMQRYVS